MQTEKRSSQNPYQHETEKRSNPSESIPTREGIGSRSTRTKGLTCTGAAFVQRQPRRGRLWRMRPGCWGNDGSWGSLDPSPRSPPAGQHICGSRLIRTQTSICWCCRTRARIQARARIQLPRAKKGLGRRRRQAHRSARGLDIASSVQAHPQSPHERSSSRRKTCVTLFLATACLSSSHSPCRGTGSLRESRIQDLY